MSCRLVAALMVCALVGCGDASKNKSMQFDAKHKTARSDVSYSYRATTAEKKAEAKPSDAAAPLLPGEVAREEIAQPPGQGFDSEAYDHVDDNPFLPARRPTRFRRSRSTSTRPPTPTCAASSTQGQLPPPDAVRIEELINYFPYDYPPPTGDAPVRRPRRGRPAARGTPSTAWCASASRAARSTAGQAAGRATSSSCSTSPARWTTPNKLPLVKQALKLLVEQLDENDRVAIVVYAGAPGLVLPSTPGDRQAQDPRRASTSSQAGGSTARRRGHPAGLPASPSENFIQGGVNRVILCTDGDFNVGVTSQGELVRLIEEKAKSGVFLTVLGFGMGNLKDSTLEKLADKGNGNYAYIDTLSEARKVLVEQIGGTLVTIAKDVKIQVEFNPAQVARLPPDRLREPPAGAPRTSTTTRRTPARSAPATP